MITKCVYCSRTFKDLMDIGNHIESKHPDSIPENMSGVQAYVIEKSGKTHGTCVVCHSSTLWNPKTNKYKRFCENPKCKEKYREEFKKRMMAKYGKTTLLDDAEHQKKMLANRKISGTYVFQDGSKHTYTGSYEREFLEFLDIALEWDSSDIMTPSPHIYHYVYEDVSRFYIPDMYIPSLNLEIEIKDGGDNPNTHHKIQQVDKVKEKLKDEAIRSNIGINYLKLYNKEHDKFIQYLRLVQIQVFNNKSERLWFV